MSDSMANEKKTPGIVTAALVCAIVALALTVLGCCLQEFVLIPSLILSVTAMILSVKGKKQVKAQGGAVHKMANAAFLIALIALILGIVGGMLGVVGLVFDAAVGDEIDFNNPQAVSEWLQSLSETTK